MRTDEGDEIVEPGDYDLGDDRTLRVWLTQDDDERVEMWTCTHCQKVDGVLNALLVSVIDGQMETRQDENGEFKFSITPAGVDRVKAMLDGLGDGQDDHE